MTALLIVTLVFLGIFALCVGFSLVANARIADREDLVFVISVFAVIALAIVTTSMSLAYGSW